MANVRINSDKSSYEYSDAWSVIESYFKNKHLQQLLKHQLESFNDFIQNQIKKTIQMFKPLLIRSIHDYNKDCKKYRLEISIDFYNLCIYLKY